MAFNRVSPDDGGYRQRAQEIAEIVGQRMKLESNGIGREHPAR